MKLSELKVGMKVRRRMWLEGEWLKIEWISGNYFAGHDEKNEPFAERLQDTGDFQIVELRKKPSDRIKQIACEMAAQTPAPSGRTPRERFFPDAVMQYLDEQAETKERP